MESRVRQRFRVDAIVTCSGGAVKRLEVEELCLGRFDLARTVSLQQAFAMDCGSTVWSMAAHRGHNLRQLPCRVRTRSPSFVVQGLPV